MNNGKLVAKIIKNRPKDFFMSYLACQAMQIIPLITGLLIREVFKCYEKGTNDNTVWWFIGLFIAGLLCRMSVVLFNSIKGSVARFIVSSILRLNLMEALLSKPGAKALDKSTGDTLNSFRDDINQIEDFVAASIIEFLAVFVFAALSLFVLLRINFIATLLIFTPMIAVMLMLRTAGSRITKYRKDNRKATGVVSSAIGEIFTNIQVIKAYGSEETMKKNFTVLNKAREKYAIKDNMFSQLLATATENILSIGVGIILLVMSFSVKNGDFKLGDFTIFLYYMNFITFFIQAFSESMTRFKQAAVSFNNITEISDVVSCDGLVENTVLYMKEDVPEVKGMQLNEKEKLDTLKVDNLTYRYAETNGGIEGVSFTIQRDSFTVITGRVGAGKTTLLRTLLGLLEKEHGSILWNGKQIEKVSEVMVPPRVAYSPQIPNFFSASIQENMLLGLEKEYVDIDGAVFMAVMEEDIQNLPKGLEATIGTNGVKLSGGQQQRLSAARMFARGAQVHVFDDISSALDVETEEQLWTRIFESNNATCIAVSNRRTALKKADNIILLKDGRVEACGKLDELLEQSEEMRLIWGQSA